MTVHKNTIPTKIQPALSFFGHSRQIIQAYENIMILQGEIKDTNSKIAACDKTIKKCSLKLDEIIRRQGIIANDKINTAKPLKEDEEYRVRLIQNVGSHLEQHIEYQIKSSQYDETVVDEQIKRRRCEALAKSKIIIQKKVAVINSFDQEVRQVQERAFERLREKEDEYQELYKSTQSELSKKQAQCGQLEEKLVAQKDDLKQLILQVQPQNGNPNNHRRSTKRIVKASFRPGFRQ